MKRIVLIGGGGFAKEVREIAVLCGHHVVAYVGTKAETIDLPYWGEKEQLLNRRAEFDSVCLAFGATDRRTIGLRVAVIAWLSDNALSSTPLVSPRAIISQGATIADGAIVAHGAVLSVDSVVGAFCIVNTNAVIGHDATIERNVTVAPGAFVGGNARIREHSLLGPGSIILERRIVGAGVLVGVAATVTRNVPDGATVMPLLSRVLKN